MNYDSTTDTLKHIQKVQSHVLSFAGDLIQIAKRHDESSLQEPEKSFYDEWRPLLSSLQYGSPEYMKAIEGLRPALQHHYKSNRHHPEHFENGVNGMTLLDLIEMICDWKAASERGGGTGSALDSIKKSKERFGLSDQLTQILENTVREAGWS